MQMQMEIQFDKWQTAIKQTINGISMAANGCSGEIIRKRCEQTGKNATEWT